MYTIQSEQMCIYALQLRIMKSFDNNKNNNNKKLAFLRSSQIKELFFCCCSQFLSNWREVVFSALCRRNIHPWNAQLSLIVLIVKLNRMLIISRMSCSHRKKKNKLKHHGTHHEKNSTNYHSCVQNTLRLNDHSSILKSMCNNWIAMATN